MLSGAALLQGLSGRINNGLLAELTAEQMGWENEEFDVEQEFEGVLRKLQAGVAQDEMGQLLKLATEKGMQALTPEQRAVLQKPRRGA